MTGVCFRLPALESEQQAISKLHWCIVALVCSPSLQDQPRLVTDRMECISNQQDHGADASRYARSMK